MYTFDAEMSNFNTKIYISLKHLFQDMEMFDLEDFKYNFVNLTTFRMVDIEDVGVREVLKHMEKYSTERNQSINKFMLTQVCQGFTVDIITIHTRIIFLYLIYNF